MAKTRTSEVRRNLTLVEFESARSHIASAIAEKAADWRSHGWAVVGSKRSLRIEIAVATTTLRPAHPVEPIPLPRSMGGSIKPSVRSSLDGLSSPLVTEAPRDTASADGVLPAVTEPFAPGSRTLVDSRPIQRAGIACFVRADGTVYLLTCGHVFSPGAVDTGIFVNGELVAKLSHNSLDDDPQLDAAYCEVLPRGLQLADASRSAPTWFSRTMAPADGQGRNAVFWPVNQNASDAITTKVNSFSASESNLFNEFWDLSLGELIRTEQITIPGDSGSLLSVADCYYASCTGAPNWSYYTPLHATIQRMRTAFSEVELWQPD
jgi:hypothetical protein